MIAKMRCRLCGAYFYCALPESVEEMLQRHLERKHGIVVTDRREIYFKGYGEVV